MIRQTFLAGIVGAMALAGAALLAPAAASASEALPAAMAQKLDEQAAEFTMTAARQRRLMMIEQAQREQRYGRRGAYSRSYGRGPRYGRGPGYRDGPRRGPPPGYRRDYRY